jgi:hypothetical protein
MNVDTLMGVTPTKIGDYMLNSIQVRDETCKPFLGTNCDVTHKKSNINSESILLGLNQPLTRNIPFLKEDVLADEPIGSNAMKESYEPFEPLHTREKRPCNTLSEITINRFEQVIYHKPQDLNQIVFRETTRGGIDTRTEAKDEKVAECGNLFKIKS